MKTALIVLLLLIVVIISLFIILAGQSRSGTASGLAAGLLSKCPDKPNCVCSEYKNDVSHYIEPIAIPENNSFNTMSVIKSVIQAMGGNIQSEADNYLAATFSSAIFGFVDDLEIRLDSAQKLIHIRSASRVGHGDLGVNNKRAELLKKRIFERLSDASRILNSN